MKNLFAKYVVMSGVALLAACSTDSEVMDPTVAPEVPTKTITIVADGELTAPDGTRVNYVDKLGIDWNNTDKYLAVIDLENSATYRATFVEYDSDAKKAVFSATVGAATTEIALRYCQYWANTDYDTPNRNGNVLFCYRFYTSGDGEGYTQAAAGATHNINLIGRASLVEGSTDTFSAEFELVGVMLRILPYDSEGNTVAINSVRLDAEWGKALVGGTGKDAYIGYVKNEGVIEKVEDWNASNGQSAVRTLLTTPFSLEGVTSVATTSGIYIPIAPVTTKGYKYTVSTSDGAKYTFTSEAVKTWESGKLYDVKLNLSSAKSEKVNPALRYVFTNVTKSASVDADQTNQIDLGYYFAYVGTNDYPNFEVESSPVYRALEFTGVPDWLDCYVGETNNHIYIKAKSENLATAPRTATIDVSCKLDTELAALYTAPEGILISVTVTQLGSGKVSVRYAYQGATHSFNVPSTGITNAGASWYFAYLNGSSARVADTHEVITLLTSDTDADDWLRLRFVTNNLQYTADPIEDQTTKRSVTVHVMFDAEATTKFEADPSHVGNVIDAFEFTQYGSEYKWISGGWEGGASSTTLNVGAAAATDNIKWTHVRPTIGTTNGTQFPDKSGIFGEGMIICESSASWCSGRLRDLGDSWMVYSVEANTTGATRTATLRFKIDAETFRATFPEYNDYNIDDYILTATINQAAN